LGLSAVIANLSLLRLSYLGVIDDGFNPVVNIINTTFVNLDLISSTITR
jgi:hypothetical protein